MKNWVEFSFLLNRPYEKISKGSVVNIQGDSYIVKRVDGIILLDESVLEPNTVQVFARGVKR